MERLEAAIEKARQQRGPQTQEPTTQTAIPISTEAPLDAWQVLQEIKVSNRTARANRITTLTTGPNSGPYDMLRSRTMRIMRENKWKRLAITSPDMACGKTTVAANLAFSLARQSDNRVILFDMDLRRPSLQKVLAHRHKYSLHQVLEGTASAEDQFVRFGTNLIFGLNQKPAQNPAELLQSARTKKFLDEVERRYKPDFMLFDMPPMLSSDDNVGFLENVDCGLLVGAAEETHVTHLDTCEKELAELTNVLGIVLNKCRYKEPGSGYEYDYY